GHRRHHQAQAGPAPGRDDHGAEGGDLQQHDDPRLGQRQVVGEDLAQGALAADGEVEGDAHDATASGRAVTAGERTPPSSRDSASRRPTRTAPGRVSSASSAALAQSSEASAWCVPRAGAGSRVSTSTAPATICSSSTTFTAMAATRTGRTPLKASMTRATLQPRKIATTAATTRWNSLSVARCAESSWKPLPQSGQPLQAKPAPLATTRPPLSTSA